MITKDFESISQAINDHFLQKHEHNLQSYGECYLSADSLINKSDFSKYLFNASGTFATHILQMWNHVIMSFQSCSYNTTFNRYQKDLYIPAANSKDCFCESIYYDTPVSPFHRHDYIEIIYVYSGQYVEIIGNEERTFSEKQVCILNQNCEHQDFHGKSYGLTVFLGLPIGNGNQFILQNLKNSPLKNFISESVGRKSNTSYLCLSPRPTDTAIIESYLALLFGELESEEPGYSKIMQIYQLRILNALTHCPESQQISLPSSSRNKLLFHVLEEYIENNLAIVSLESLCNKFHYQRDYYNRLIRKNTGLSFSGYLRKLRMERARYLLTNTSIPIKDICLSLGYKDLSYFYSFFKKETGFTPLEYRNSSS